MQNLGCAFPTHPLPARIIPCPWEDLASVLSRSAQDMDYKHVLWLLSIEEIPYCKAAEVCLLRKLMSYQILEHLLVLNEQRLYEMTFHRFAAQLQPLTENSLRDDAEEIQRPLLTLYTLNRFIASCEGSKVCPLCLAEGECYGHLYWNMNPIVTCPRHNILLVDRCPMCLKSIPVLRTSLTHCPRCQKGDYRQA